MEARTEDQQHVIYAESAPAANGEDLGDRVRNLIDTVIRAQAALELAAPDLAEQAAADARQVYRRREQELGTAVIRELERRVILSVLDRSWREHLQAMPGLQNAIAIRTTGAAALAEYRREGALLFNRMREAANREIVRTLFRIRTEQRGTAPQA